MITLGPFRIADIDKLREILDTHGAVHELVADEELRDKQTREFHEYATLAPRQAAGTLDLRYIFVEISEDEFKKVAAEFEKLAILPPSDGAWELAEEEENS
jgi:hypothetical protein